MRRPSEQFLIHCVTAVAIWLLTPFAPPTSSSPSPDDVNGAVEGTAVVKTGDDGLKMVNLNSTEIMTPLTTEKDMIGTSTLSSESVDITMETDLASSMRYSEAVSSDTRLATMEEGDPRCQAVCVASCTWHNVSWNSCLQECANVSGCIDCESPCFNQSQGDPPPTCSPVRATLPRPGYIILNWTVAERPQANKDGVVYVIQRKKMDGPMWHTITMTKNTVYNLSDIDVCQYILRVAAVSRNGTSPFQEVQFRGQALLPDVGEIKVLQENIQEMTSGKVIIPISWKPPAGWEGAITSYTVSATPKKCMTSSSIHAHDRKYVVNTTSVDIVVQANKTEDCMTFELYGNASCMMTKKRHETKQTVPRLVAKLSRPRAENINHELSLDLLAPGTFQANLSWPAGTRQGVESVILFWGPSSNEFFLNVYIFKRGAKRNVSLPRDSTWYVIQGLQPEEQYGADIVFLGSGAKLSKAQKPAILFTTGKLPTVIPSTAPTTQQTVKIVLPNQPGSVKFHAMSLYIAVPLSLTLLLIFVAYCGVCIWRRNDRSSKANLSRDEESIPNIYSSPSYPALLSNCQVKPDVMDRWEISPARIKVGDVLGEGAFGQVLKGLVVGRIWSHQSSLSAIVPREATHGEHTVVAVKMLHKFAEDNQKQEFLREIELMKELGYHPNVVSLLGCCTIQDPICLLVEHCYYGDLLHYLRNRRPQLFDQIKSGRIPRTPGSDSLKPMDLLSFARQIAMGMEYISQKGFVHRDLAARNVMVANDKNVKIGDFGLTRYVYDDKVYINRRGGKLPVKWMSLEAIYDQVFTTMGDVWSYGVVLFEIITMGGAPYPGISNKDMPKLLKGGYRMEKPENCSVEVFDMMKSCWSDDPEVRPGFSELRNKLEELMEENVCYMEFDTEKQPCYYYSSSSSSDDSSSSNSLDAEVEEESPMLETNMDKKDAFLVTPMLKIPTDIAPSPLQSRSTQNLRHLSPCKRMVAVSLSLNGLDRNNLPLRWMPSDTTTFARNIDNNTYYMGNGRTSSGPLALGPAHHIADQKDNTNNPYSGIVGSLEDVHSKGVPIYGHLAFECPQFKQSHLCAGSHDHKPFCHGEDQNNEDRDSCLGEDNEFDDERERMIRKNFGQGDALHSDLSPDDSREMMYPSLSSLKHQGNTSQLVSPTSLDSGVSCDTMSGRLVVDVCRGIASCKAEDLIS